MRGAISSGLLIFATAICASQAHARDVKISGTHSVSDIEIHCIDNGGTFFNAPQGGYGCAGSGGGTVTCTGKGKCTGTVSKVVGKGGKGAKGSGIAGVVKALNASSGSARQEIHPSKTNASMSSQSDRSDKGGSMHHGRNH